MNEVFFGLYADTMHTINKPLSIHLRHRDMMKPQEIRTGATIVSTQVEYGVGYTNKATHPEYVKWSKDQLMLENKTVIGLTFKNGLLPKNYTIRFKIDPPKIVYARLISTMDILADGRIWYCGHFADESINRQAIPKETVYPNMKEFIRVMDIHFGVDKWEIHQEENQWKFE